MIVPFNVPYISGREIEFINEAINKRELSGDGHFTSLNENFIKELTGCKCVLLTSSCTHALEIIALLLDIEPGDEIIMSSFNFVSAANAFVLRGANIVFVDIHPEYMNINAELIESAITPRTKAILAMHYGGLACDMDKLKSISKKFQIPIIEDAAHCIDSYYKGEHLGTIGDFGTISFHSTKNIHCGEGGALLINNEKFIERAFVIRDKGTNRYKFISGDVEKYTWIDKGSSYFMSEISAAFLYAQLIYHKLITQKRKIIWTKYNNFFNSIDLKTTDRNHNAHIFHIKLKDHKTRDIIIRELHNKGISSCFHYIPLHDSTGGKQFSRFEGEDIYTSQESKKLLRLPIFASMTDDQLHYVLTSIEKLL